MANEEKKNEYSSKVLEKKEMLFAASCNKIKKKRK
jgi:hypothetical protein